LAVLSAPFTAANQGTTFQIDLGGNVDLSVAGATLTYRLCVSAATSGNTFIQPFVQNGGEFLWQTWAADVNVSNQSSSAIARVLSVPTGVQVNALIRGMVQGTGGGIIVVLTSMDENDQNPSGSATTAITSSSNAMAFGHINIRTDVNAQIRSRGATASTTLKIYTFGWVDRLGR
jgi:hypothetical protein